MNETQLIDELRAADAAAGAPPLAPGLAERVRRRAARRRLLRRTAAAAWAVAACLLAAWAWWWAGRRGPGPTAIVPPAAVRPSAAVPSVGPAAIAAGLRELDDEADAHQRVVERLLAREAAGRAAAAGRDAAGGPDPIDAVRQQADRAAYLMLLRASRLETEAHGQQEAGDVRRRVMELFPQTPWATVARQQQAAPPRGKGET